MLLLVHRGLVLEQFARNATDFSGATVETNCEAQLHGRPVAKAHAEGRQGASVLLDVHVESSLGEGCCTLRR